MKMGFGKSKWISFCEEMLSLGFVVELYEARQTRSKYCTIMLPDNRGKQFKVRFSDHKPIYRRELAGDCDFFVGKTNTGVRTTWDAANAVCNFFGVRRFEDQETPKACYGVVEDFI